MATRARSTDGSRDLAVSHYDDTVEHDTETRRSFATTEFWIFLVLGIAVLFFAYENGRDSLSRQDGWWFVTSWASAT